MVLDYTVYTNKSYQIVHDSLLHGSFCMNRCQKNKQSERVVKTKLVCVVFNVIILLLFIYFQSSLFLI